MKIRYNSKIGEFSEIGGARKEGRAFTSSSVISQSRESDLRQTGKAVSSKLWIVDEVFFLIMLAL